MNVDGVERTNRERLLDRRRFLPTLAAAAAAVASGGLPSKSMPCAVATTTPSSPSETAVKELWKGLTDAQKSRSALVGTIVTRSGACCGLSSPTTGRSRGPAFAVTSIQ